MAAGIYGLAGVDACHELIRADAHSGTAVQILYGIVRGACLYSDDGIVIEYAGSGLQNGVIWNDDVAAVSFRLKRIFLAASGRDGKIFCQDPAVRACLCFLCSTYIHYLIEQREVQRSIGVIVDYDTVVDNLAG